MNVISDFLLVKNNLILDVAKTYNSYILMAVSFMFILACLFSYYLEPEPEKLLLKGIFTALIIILGGDIALSLADLNVELADENFQTFFTPDFLKRLPDLKEFKGGSMLEMIEGGLGAIGASIASLCAVIGFMICSIAYTAGIHMAVAFLGLPALIALLPRMGHYYMSTLITLAWIVVTPHVVGFTLAVTSVLGLENISDGVMDVAESALLIVTSFLIGLAPLVAYSLVAGRGIAGGMAAFSGVASMNALQTAKRSVGGRGAGGVLGGLGQSLAGGGNSRGSGPGPLANYGGMKEALSALNPSNNSFNSKGERVKKFSGAVGNSVLSNATPTLNRAIGGNPKSTIDSRELTKGLKPRGGYLRPSVSNNANETKSSHFSKGSVRSSGLKNASSKTPKKKQNLTNRKFPRYTDSNNNINKSGMEGRV